MREGSASELEEEEAARRELVLPYLLSVPHGGGGGGVHVEVSAAIPAALTQEDKAEEAAGLCELTFGFSEEEGEEEERGVGGFKAVKPSSPSPLLHSI
jgi:hypothetical protein